MKKLSKDASVKVLKKKRRYLLPLKPYINADSRVLEIGPGWGTLLKLIQDTYHSHVLGVEISELAARVASEHYKLPIKNKIFQDFARDYKGEKFDVIMIMHVLEHFVDPNDVLDQARSLLSPNGILYIAVPNLMNPDEPLDRYFHFEHVHYFTAYSLAKLLQKHGFKVLWHEDTHEIKMIAAFESHPASSIDINKRESDYSIDKIARVVIKQKNKYAFLRVFKAGAFLLLPNETFKKVQKSVARKLRKLGVIDT